MQTGNSRRGFLKIAAAGMTGAAFAPARAFSAARRGNPIGARAADTPIRLGVASYSFRKFSLPEAIAMTKELRAPWINIKSFHIPYDSTPEEIAAARKLITDAGLQIVGGGTITFEEDTDEEVRKYFEYAKNAGMPLIVMTAAPEILPRIEKFVKMYDIKAAIHNHGPEDHHYHAPADALKYIKDMDPRMGLCVDVGHTARTGTDPVQAIADAGSRVLDMHMKDLADMMVKESQVAVGEGKMPIPDIFRELIKLNYPGYVNLEYEIHADDPLPGMQQSFSYMRGVLAGMGVPGATASID
ncbi:MAG TPA: sugar phosphate isomerase/epimerase [Rhodothermales bacterium]|nr:sugar phosphate isomerase/epimerase [Rhodothermales bacterium]